MQLVCVKHTLDTHSQKRAQIGCFAGGLIAGPTAYAPTVWRQGTDKAQAVLGNGMLPNFEQHHCMGRDEHILDEGCGQHLGCVLQRSLYLRWRRLNDV